MPDRRPAIIISLLLGAPALSALGAPHQHGSARLNVALEAGRLVVELESPLHDLVGFEHAPRNERERAALAALGPALRDAARSFRPSPEAGCRAENAEISLPFAAPAGGGAGAPAPRDGHAELRARWTLACSAPGALRSLEVLLFDAFPRLQRIRAQTATPRGQGGATLTPKRRELPL